MFEYQFQSDFTISNLHLLFCGMEQCAPSHSYGPAARPYYLLHHVLKGKGTFSCCGKEYSLQPGQGFLIVPGQVTRYQADAADPWQYLWIAIDRQGAKSLFDSTTLSAQSPIYTAPPSHPLHSVFLSLTQALQQQTLNSFTLLSSFFSIFSHLSQLVPAPTKKRSIQADYVEKAEHYMLSRYYEDISIEDVARFVGISRKYLCRIFGQFLQLTPSQYLLQVRLDAACDLLRNSHICISDIARSVGYSDCLVFSRMFRTHLGLSPTLYRKKLQSTSPSSGG